ncbi:MAG: hypothetical protein WBL23_10440 [Salinisphaera sp.]|uniref:hypothetical protein n=1 Tax=Salinisphaera sp. TaxID=1914330 RepID=UPI003C7E3E3B
MIKSVDQERRVSEFIKRELASCCADYGALLRTRQLDAQSPLARAIEMLRPSLGLLAWPRAIELMNHHARKAVVSGNVDRAGAQLLFCGDCGWTGAPWETAGSHCPYCRASDSPGRLLSSDGDPLSFFRGRCAGEAP